MSRNRRQGPGHNEANRQTRESRQKAKMLDTGREAHFRYDVEELLVATGMAPEEWRPFLQTLWIKGSRTDLDEARDFLDDCVKDGRIDDDMRAKILPLIRRYSTFR